MPEDFREQHERDIKSLQQTYGKAMLEPRTKKTYSPFWAKKRNDLRPPAGPERRRLHGLDLKGLPMV